MAKTDSTGQFAMVADGTSPASPVLADGSAVYTPGLSERRNGASLFRHDDLLGSLRFLTDSSETVQANRLFSGFGATVVSSGAAWESFGWLGDAGDQTDADTGLVLMGHRLYDSRLGRFLSQDPAGDGDNWYAYCDNDPINGLDPSGLFMIKDPDMLGASYTGQNDWGDYRAGLWGTYDWFASDGKGGMKYSGTTTLGPTYSDFFLGGGMGTNMGHGAMFAGGKGLVLPKDPTGLPEGWKQDPGHLDPNGSRHHGPDGEGLEYGKPQPGKTGWKDKEHWHKLRLKDGKWQKDKSVGRNGHLLPGETVS